MNRDVRNNFFLSLNRQAVRDTLGVCFFRMSENGSSKAFASFAIVREILIGGI